MNTKQEIIGAAAGKAAAECSRQAKQASGWKRWLWSIGAAIAAAVAWFASGFAQRAPEEETPPAEQAR